MSLCLATNRRERPPLGATWCKPAINRQSLFEQREYWSEGQNTFGIL
ncbi:hypothetical protein I2494_16195 [Budviciaceae bacterium BWR-B9]|uniref:Uncharacterized protein n=1 Tax=Limnobaculum allomyrinae TaxID=2791986 RepID=A0ABS1ITZ7_9GAMM|nr:MULTISPECIES: hypothetical protein [Limnobaculum]MBK5145228.1 hypothetical protein [Limnobaculum allomyrinae]MBV7693060.1 hypothetical protein [Limnobaculum sp. M2-1]